MLTINDIVERLKQIDEVSLMEVLEITSEDMVSRFLDRIDLKYEKLVEELADDYSEMEEQDLEKQNYDY